MTLIFKPRASDQNLPIVNCNAFGNRHYGTIENPIKSRARQLGTKEGLRPLVPRTPIAQNRLSVGEAPNLNFRSVHDEPTRPKQIRRDQAVAALRQMLPAPEIAFDASGNTADLGRVP